MSLDLPLLQRDLTLVFECETWANLAEPSGDTPVVAMSPPASGARGGRAVARSCLRGGALREGSRIAAERGELAVLSGVAEGIEDEHLGL